MGILTGPHFLIRFNSVNRVKPELKIICKKLKYSIDYIHIIVYTISTKAKGAGTMKTLTKTQVVKMLMKELYTLPQAVEAYNRISNYGFYEVTKEDVKAFLNK